MVLKIAQDYAYQGEDWWKWWIWLEGPDEVLDDVDHVVYTLHPTFPNPVKKIKKRSTKFKLKASGWGVFTIYAKVVMKDKKEVKLEHHLDLDYPTEE